MREKLEKAYRDILLLGAGLYYNCDSDTHFKNLHDFYMKDDELKRMYENDIELFLKKVYQHSLDSIRWTYEGRTSHVKKIYLEINERVPNAETLKGFEDTDKGIGLTEYKDVNQFFDELKI